VVAGAKGRSADDCCYAVAREPESLPRFRQTASLVASGIVDKIECAVIVREIPIATGQTVSFFHALAPALVANVLTVVFVYCFAMINQQEKRGEEGRLTHIWLLVMILFLMLYGLYTWGVYPFKKS
jgi:hypothetical protein